MKELIVGTIIGALLAVAVINQVSLSRRITVIEIFLNNAVARSQQAQPPTQ